jgi:Zn-dependent protease with chaperone function
MTARWLATIVTATAMLAGCAAPSSAPSPSPQPAGRPTSSGRPVDGRQAERLQRVMTPLIQAMNKPLPLNQVKVGILDDTSINAASAGGGEFYVTRGLLEKANDEQLTGVLAHEVAHDDLGHVAKAQALGAGLNIGMIILDQIIPGSGAVTPIAGELIARKYSRSEEYAADRHGVELLKRTGKSKDTMINTLTWLMQTEGTSGGGFFATHPATEDRLQALRDLK